MTTNTVQPDATTLDVPGDDAGTIDGFYAVIPAGGAGTRLWPLSREARPKFLLDLTGSGRTLLQATVDRLVPLATAERVVVVTGAKHVGAVAEQLDVAQEHLVAEPSPKDSMAAIGLVAAILQHRHGPVVIGSFAADHVISGLDAFHGAVRQAVAVARAGYVVTIGIAATKPSTAFGYIHTGALLQVPGAPDARIVRSFTEKPDAQTAQKYLATGEYRWNAGMFVVRTDVLLANLRKQHPALHDGLVAIAAAWDGPERDAVLGEIWPSLTKIAIDHAVAEPVADDGGMAVVPGQFGWDDLGDFASLSRLFPAEDAAGNRVLGDASSVLAVNSAGTFTVPDSGRLVAVLGLDDVVVIDTPDALLVTTRARAQQVKDVVTALRDRDQGDLL